MQVALKQGEQELILNPRPEMIGLDDIDIVLRSKSFPEQIPDKLGKILAQRSSEIISRIRMMEGTQGSDLASAIEFSKSKTCTHDVLTCATNQRADMKLLKTAAERTLADPKTPYYLKRSIEDYLILLEILDDEDRVFELMYIADKLISAGEVETAYMMIIDNQQNILGLANHYFQNVPREFYQDPDLINLFSESDRFRAETWSKYDGGGLARYQKFRADLDSLLKSRDNVPSSVFLAGYRKLVQQLEYPRYLEDLIAYAKLERDGLRTVKGIFIIEGKPGKSNQLIYISKEDQAVLFDINPESFRESVVSYRLCPDKLEEAALNPRSRMNILLREGIDPRPIIQQIKSGALPKGIVNRVVKKFPTDHLRKIADEASDEAKKQAEDLILQLKKGDPSPGKGNEPLQETRFYYMRSENARVVIDRVGNNYYVVGICDKSQEDATFALLRSLKF
jgi:hypothetical protein